MMFLTVNAGSSSVRLDLLEVAGDHMERRKSVHHDHPSIAADIQLQTFLAQEPMTGVQAVAHRIVHGGARWVRPCLVTEEVEADILRLAAIAPLHNPAAVQWIRACRGVLGPAVAQVAVFDTAFYATLPPVAYRYALPRELCEQLGIRRYGFHGLAHQSMWRRWRALHPDADAARVISLQLGSGCSITAVRDGCAVDTSMGFSPLEGLVMATRSGDVDPGVLLYLQRALPMTPERMETLLNDESGLLGIAGTSSDMRALLSSTDEHARLAVDLYCYRARKYIGAYLAVLGGVDAILFGGGVGENAPTIRQRILEGLQWADVALDEAANNSAIGVAARISGIDSVPVHVVPVDEAVLLATDAHAVTMRREGH